MIKMLILKSTDKHYVTIFLVTLIQLQCTCVQVELCCQHLVRLRYSLQWLHDHEKQYAITVRKNCSTCKVKFVHIEKCAHQKFIIN